MKKPVYSLFMFALVAILLPSCSTQLSTVSITKRHYNNGYYVDFNNKHRLEETFNKETKSAPAESTPITSPVTASSSNISENTPVEERIIATSTAPTPKGKKSITELTAYTIKHSGPVNLKYKITPNTLKEIKNFQTESKYLNSTSKGHNNSNNSLIWTIIIVLLILWLLSYLTGGWGLGGLIWLFLVVALIILLLKLLGVI